MKQNLIALALCIVVALATFYFTKNAQPVKSTRDAMEILGANGQVSVVSDTLMYVPYSATNGGFSSYEINALAYLSDEYDAIHLETYEGFVNKQLWYEVQTDSDSVKVFKLRREGIEE